MSPVHQNEIPGPLMKVAMILFQLLLCLLAAVGAAYLLGGLR